MVGDGINAALLVLIVLAWLSLSPEPSTPETPPTPVATQSLVAPMPQAPVSQGADADCPQCNCGDLLTQLSMGTAPLAPEQSRFLKTNCR